MKLFAKKPLPDGELIRLREELDCARGELTAAYNSFNQALDSELVEACVYRICAATARCNYLLRSLKARCPHAAAQEDEVWI